MSHLMCKGTRKRCVNSGVPFGKGRGCSEGGRISFLDGRGRSRKDGLTQEHRNGLGLLSPPLS